MKVEFEIPGKPMGKGRPRFARAGKYVRTYTPNETVNYENLVKLMYKAEAGAVFLHGAIMAEIIAYFPIPASASKKKKAAMAQGTEYTHKCDTDNIAKIVLDSLNGIAYDDDAQVSRLHVRKTYTAEPKVTVRLTELEAEDYQNTKIGE